MPNRDNYLNYFDFVDALNNFTISGVPIQGVVGGTHITCDERGVLRTVDKKNEFEEKIDKIIVDNLSFISEREVIENECQGYYKVMEDSIKNIISNKKDLSQIFDFFLDIGCYNSFMHRSDIVPTMIELYFQLDTDTYNQMVATFTDLLKHKEHPRHKVAKVFLIIKSYIEKTAYARNNESIRIVRNGGRVDRKSFGEIEVAEF